MGLFDIFKKKPPSHEEKVDLAYRCYKPEIVKSVFPGGKQQASNIIISLAKLLYGINLGNCTAKEYHRILTIFSGVLTRKVITPMTNQDIIDSLQVRYSDCIIDQSTAEKVLAYCILNMKNKDFVLDNDEDYSVLELLIDSFRQMEEIASENIAAENANLNDPEYGLVVSKPIFTKGVRGSQTYLDSLRTPSGEKLTWTRLGSTSSPEVNGMIDIYQGILPSGNIYKKLYVNMYGSKNSIKIPKGFTS